MKTLITIFLFFLVSHFDACKESEEQAMRELLKEKPHAVINTKNLFAGKGNEIRYYIVNPKDKRKVEAIEERAMIYGQEEQRRVIRVDSIQKANLIIRL
jgi:hypothetical protein